MVRRVGGGGMWKGEGGAQSNGTENRPSVGNTKIGEAREETVLEDQKERGGWLGGLKEKK